MKNFVKGFVLVCCMLPFAGVYSAAPCSTGVSSVTSSWWSPNNDTTYTMCGCQTEKGYSSGGNCASGVSDGPY